VDVSTAPSPITFSRERILPRVIAIKWCSTYDLCTLHVILLSENEPLKTEEGSKKKLKSLTQSKV
jgi:hypothetical protein